MATKSKLWSRILIYIVMTVCALFVVFPFIWMFSVSLKTLTEYNFRPIKLFNFTLTWENYKNAFVNMNILKYALNSVYVSVFVCVLQIVTSVCAAFAFALLEFRGKKLMFGTVMATMMMPTSIMLVPLYLVVKNLGFSNTYAAMILPFGFTGFGIFLLRQYFLSLPRDLKQAAEIDGAGYFRILWQIYFPLAMPGVMSLTIIAFIGIFNSILWPQVSISSDNLMVMPVRMLSMVSFDRTLNPPSILSFAAVCVVLPVIVFVSLQKFFVKGYVLSGIKG